MSTDTLFPSIDEHAYTAAEHVNVYPDSPDADPEIASVLRERALPSAKSALTTRADHQSRQGLWRFAHGELILRNDEADEALSEHNLALHLKGEDIYNIHQHLWGGGGVSNIARSPYPTQIQSVRGYIARVDADPEAARAPEERLARVRETNDALEVAWKAEREAKRAWTLASEAAEEARDAFLTDYRATVRYLIAVFGEERVRRALPSFPRRAKKTS